MQGARGARSARYTSSQRRRGPATVYSGDLKSSDDKVKPLYDNIPLTDLADNQEIELEALAELGFGKDHAKWQGAIVGYEEDKGKYKFVVETACGLSASQIVEKALRYSETSWKTWRLMWES